MYFLFGMESGDWMPRKAKVRPLIRLITIMRAWGMLSDVVIAATGRE